jgi:flagellar basal-body rod protein FlgC
MNLEQSLMISGAGMNVQSQRLRMISENIANADSTGRSPEEEPYRRQTMVFKNVLDKALGFETVKVAKRGHDMSAFNLKYDPSHPAADERGYIRMPNVSTIIEMVDMREARRGYEANINMVEVTKAMVQRTLDLLR